MFERVGEEMMNSLACVVRREKQNDLESDNALLLLLFKRASSSSSSFSSFEREREKERETCLSSHAHGPNHDDERFCCGLFPKERRSFFVGLHHFLKDEMKKKKEDSCLFLNPNI